MGCDVAFLTGWHRATPRPQRGNCWKRRDTGNRSAAVEFLRRPRCPRESDRFPARARMSLPRHRRVGVRQDAVVSTRLKKPSQTVPHLPSRGISTRPLARSLGPIHALSTRSPAQGRFPASSIVGPAVSFPRLPRQVRGHVGPEAGCRVTRNTKPRGPAQGTPHEPEWRQDTRSQNYGMLLILVLTTKGFRNHTTRFGLCQYHSAGRYGPVPRRWHRASLAAKTWRCACERFDQTTRGWRRSNATEAPGKQRSHGQRSENPATLQNRHKTPDVHFAPSAIMATL